MYVNLSLTFCLTQCLSVYIASMYRFSHLSVCSSVWTGIRMESCLTHSLSWRHSDVELGGTTLPESWVQSV